MIRYNPKTGRWSDELPSRLCNWLAANPMIGGPVPISVFETDNFVGTAGGVSPIAVVLTNAIPAGRVVIASICMKNGGNVTGATDTRGNTWAVDRTEGPATDRRLAVVRSIITTDLQVGDTISFACSGGPNNYGVNLLACAGLVGTLDKVASANGSNTGTGSSGNTATLAQAKELCIGLAGGFANAGITITEAGGWTNVQFNDVSDANQNVAYKIVNATTALAYAPTYSSLSSWGTIIATYQGAA